MPPRPAKPENADLQDALVEIRRMLEIDNAHKRELLQQLTGESWDGFTWQ